MEKLLEMFFGFKELVFIGVAVGLVFFIVFSTRAGDIGWQKRNIRFYGIFIGLTVREYLWISVGAVRILFIIVVCIFTQRMGIAHTALYIALFLLSEFTFFGFPRVLIDLINAAVGYAALTTLSILMGYFTDINNNPMILVIYILLSLFTVLYSVYFFLRGLSDLIRSKLGYNQRRVARG
jgi:hypothetical protein